MGNAISLPFKIAKTTLSFYGGFFHYLFGGGRKSPYLLGDESTFPYFKPSADDSDDVSLFKRHARIHLYTLASAFYLWNKPHYRKGSYRDDLRDNFRNVAVPGTGVPLSIFVRNKLLALGFTLTANPAICLVASFHQWFKTRFSSSISGEYAARLLAPDDWFSYWRLNCRVAGLHALLNDVPPGYDMENKWTFLVDGEKQGVPVSPYMKTPGIVVKHRNEEGGMGIYFYKNAADGGDWIIQERIQNSDWVSTLLPSNAPLSTFRVISQSHASIDLTKKPKKEDITALSCVFRAGRKGASTDHDSILFDVDVKTGKILGGTTNAHWYRLGLHESLPGRCPWRSKHGYTHHPDGDIEVTGKSVPDIRGMLDLVEESHLKLCPDVPFVGWDVVLSADEKLPVCLLEVNLSCNFFRGSFDKKVYLEFIDDALVKLQAQRLTADAEGKVFKVKTA
uniref:Alpha-L-glutamate ligase-related protein ATP-grasp domain-containing protein n=1 Tax=Odontella aurita TaxID=265563 RepID=A0A7S4MEK1_9STRA|mmetsp:Transcript_19804/g.57464  ORF Transcript_19804/g.57464 Transcript_19804/m.57464 type:complete len:450 (+) Transcript_19804:226-1575(+)|eukprot:CAMPEP_0113554218 /NCGR_PEP_ID=MMETSP0015_2-20120614/16030_1 /TAXON_ID=2838 /ORGANISM="Odontella" /LENGTH=449 /DNA_ID=CAMNT_0000455341 /DNA_START=202 /DNA_END=1551 /DNA_ORIENTATION=+ /assembly_acc=CAM_ASM_000160